MASSTGAASSSSSTTASSMVSSSGSGSASSSGSGSASSSGGGGSSSGDADGGACPASGDPIACDDGTGSLGTKAACALTTDSTATESYHLKVSGSAFAPSGACVFVTPSSCMTTAGDVLQFSGSGGNASLENQFNGTLRASPYCYRLLDVLWDSEWEDDGMSTGGPLGMGGNVLAASQKPQALIAWVHEHLRTSGATPLCARGNSGGSSELLYQLMHNGGEAMLDHVQIVSATPFGRIDLGCDATTPEEGANVVCSGLPASTSPLYTGGAQNLVRTITHDPGCNATGHTLSASERASLQAMSLVTSGFAPMTLQKTSLSAFMCSHTPNATQGNAVYVFGVDADMTTQGIGAYTGLISLDLATPFYGCAAGEVCPPHVVCGADCGAETFGDQPDGGDAMELFDDLKTNCVSRH